MGLTIDTVLPELSVCFLYGSLSLSPSILELTVRLLAWLISQNGVVHSLRGMFGLWSANLALYNAASVGGAAHKPGSTTRRSDV